MVTFITFTSTGGRIGRIHWANTAPFRGGTIWGQMQWDKLWPAKPEKLFSARIRRYAELVRSVGKSMPPPSRLGKSTVLTSSTHL